MTADGGRRSRRRPELLRVVLLVGVAAGGLALTLGGFWTWLGLPAAANRLLFLPFLYPLLAALTLLGQAVADRRRMTREGTARTAATAAPPGGLLAGTGPDAALVWDHALGRFEVLAGEVAAELANRPAARPDLADHDSLLRVAHDLAAARDALAAGDLDRARARYAGVMAEVQGTWQPNAPLGRDLAAAGSHLLGAASRPRR